MDRNSAIIMQFGTKFTVRRACGIISGFTSCKRAAEFCDELGLIWIVDELTETE